jgi:hypothetical protein
MQGQSIDGREANQLLGLIRKRLLVVDEDLEDLLFYSAGKQEPAGSHSVGLTGWEKTLPSFHSERSPRPDGLGRSEESR